MATHDQLKNHLKQQDLQHEDVISRNPYHLKSWWNYLDYKIDAKPVDRYVIYERALKFLPRSYKLWHKYLIERTEQLENKRVSDKRLMILVNTYERALIQLHKMPRIWMDYCDLLISMLKGTETRHIFDRALQALPITQHKKIWEMYITWAKEFGVSETTVRVYRRYLMYDQSNREDFVTYLEEINLFGEAARQLSLCVDDDTYISSHGHTKHQMWMRLCDICSNYPEEVSSILKVDSIIRSGISKFTDEVGKLWSKLADYYVRMGQFERSRDVYEEAINSVTTVRDFTIVFDSYIKVEESIISAKLAMMQEKENDLKDSTDGEYDELKSEIELSMSRLEYLMDKRPLLLNSVILRQNPHNVHEWHKRLKLFNNDSQRKLITFVEAVKTVDPKKSNGKLSSLWLSFAKFYEKNNDLINSRTIYKKATDINFKNDDELANIWCAWGEMELRHDNFDNALSVMQQAVMEPISAIKKRYLNSSEQSEKNSMNTENYEGSVCSDRVYKNVKVWALYLDLEESLGTVETCRAAYNRCLELKVITAQMILNYAQYLEENNYFEESFKIYEQGVYLFTYPQVKKIWLVYLDKFMERYEGNKLERLRDLFEKSIKNVPISDSAEFYIKYAKAEETYGLVRHSIDVYDRATRIVPEESKLDMYRLYIKKVEQHYGVTKTRSVYERAISELNDDMSREMCLQFSQMETKLGEIDRARSILIHGSQFADVRREPSYWQKWRDFEESHGNEDTFRDMLRIQRSVEIAFSQTNYLAAEMASQTSVEGFVPAVRNIGDMERKIEMEANNNNESMLSGKRKFVASSSNDKDSEKNKALKINSLQINSDDINIDDDNQEDEVENYGIVHKTIPSAVFGSAI